MSLAYKKLTTYKKIHIQKKKKKKKKKKKQKKKKKKKKKTRHNISLMDYFIR
jgi:hypothetical protein